MFCLMAGAYVLMGVANKWWRRDVLCLWQLDEVLVISQLNEQNIFFIISLLYASTCFEHCCAHHEVKLYYTASGIVTPVRWPSGVQVERVRGRPVCKLRESVAVRCASWESPWPSGAQVERVRGRPVRGLREDCLLSTSAHRTATYRCDDNRCCIIHFWPPDDEHNSARNM